MQEMPQVKPFPTRTFVSSRNDHPHAIEKRPHSNSPLIVVDFNSDLSSLEWMDGDSW